MLAARLSETKLLPSPGKLLGVAIFYLAYHNAEGMYLQPCIMASAVGMPGVAIVAALLFGGEIAGFVGMAFALARTTNLKVGTSVAVLPGRHPVLVAKQLASLAGGKYGPLKKKQLSIENGGGEAAR